MKRTASTLGLPRDAAVGAAEDAAASDELYARLSILGGGVFGSSHLFGATPFEAKVSNENPKTNVGQ